MHISKSLVLQVAVGASVVQGIAFPDGYLPNFANLKRDALSSLEGAKSVISDLMRRKDGSSGSGSSGSGSSGSGSSGSGSSGSGSGKCPPVWSSISAQLTTMFLATDGSGCTDDARAAIREAFHDAGTWSKTSGFGGADGSLILAQEYFRPENGGLEDISKKLLHIANQWGVGVADMIQFAAAHAIVTCPKGPVVKTFVGRKDSSTPSPGGLLPDVHANAADLYKLFQDKGFNAVELAALLGAHSTSRQFGVDKSPGNVGLPQDSTPGVWDTNFYGETLNPPVSPKIFRLPSDIALAQHPEVGKEFKGFVGNQGKWTGKFADAMAKLAMLGAQPGPSGFIDCTSALPKGTQKRDVKAAGIYDRVYR